MRLLVIATVVLLSSLLSGCASYTRTHQVSLAQEVASFSGMHEFPYQTIIGRERIEVGPDSPSFDFDDGRSYFVALRIPDPAPTYINVTSKPIGQWIPTSHVFLPMVLFLDEGHQVISRLPPFLVHNPRFMHGLDFDGQAAIPEGARYVVLHSIPEAFEKRVPLFGKQPGDTRMVSVPTSGGGMFFAAMPDPASSTAVGPTGTIWVEFTSERWEIRGVQ